MAGSVNWNGPTNPSFPKSTRRNVLKASRSAPLAISPLQTLFPEGSPTRSPTFSPPHAVPGAGPRPHGPKGAAKHSPETPRPTTPAPAPSPTLSCRSAPQGGPVGTPLRPPRPDRFPEGTPPSAPADGGPQAWRPRVEPISPDSRSSLSSLSPQLPGTVSPGQPVACAVAGWAEAPDAGPRSAADCAAEPSSSSSSSSSDLAPDSLAQGCPMHYSSHYDYQPLSRYPCHPFGRCSHKPQWERLRSKRGYTYFQCQECGLTWRQLTKTQDSAQNKGFDKACAGILEKGIEALSKDLTSRNVSDLGLGTAVCVCVCVCVFVCVCARARVCVWPQVCVFVVLTPLGHWVLGDAKGKGWCANCLDLTMAV